VTFFRPKSQVSTKAHKCPYLSLKLGAFSELPLKHLISSTWLTILSSPKSDFYSFFSLKHSSSWSFFLPTKPWAPTPLNSHLFFTQARISMRMGWARVEDKEEGFQGLKIIGNFSNPLALSFSFTWVKVWAWIAHFRLAKTARIREHWGWFGELKFWNFSPFSIYFHVKLELGSRVLLPSEIPSSTSLE